MSILELGREASAEAALQYNMQPQQEPQLTMPFWDPEIEETSLLLRFLVRKTKQNIIRPALPPLEEGWVDNILLIQSNYHLLKSSFLHLWVTRLRTSYLSICRHVWREPGWAGQPACDLCCFARGLYFCSAGVDAVDHPRQRADRGTTAGRWMAAAVCWGKMCWIASVCFCAAKNY